MTTFEGGCACGKTRYRMTFKPLFVHCRHCLRCQRETGGAFVLNALIETDRLEFQLRNPQGSPSRPTAASPIGSFGAEPAARRSPANMAASKNCASQGSGRSTRPTR